MVGTSLTLSGSELDDARAVATWGVLDAAMALCPGVHQYERWMSDVLDDRVALLARTGEPYDRSAEIDADLVASLLDVARECGADASGALGDDPSGERDDFYREQWALAARVVALLADRP